MVWRFSGFSVVFQRQTSRFLFNENVAFQRSISLGGNRLNCWFSRSRLLRPEDNLTPEHYTASMPAKARPARGCEIERFAQ